MYPFLDYVGYYGPIILFVLTFYGLINRGPYLMVFTSGSIINMFLNMFLKNIFREPRPKGQLEFIDEYSGVHNYGFPSGHAQASFFALAFLFFAQGPDVIIYFMTFLCGLTLYQRWKYRRHSVIQLIAGSITGIAFAWGLVYLTQYYLYRHLNFQI
jgi:membrane-associated phospholipid phosphatase